MRIRSIFIDLVRLIRWRLLSFPIYFKIVGIGLLTAFIFGGSTLYLVKRYLTALHYPLLEQRNISTAFSLASLLERRILTGNLFDLQKQLRKEQDAHPDIRYIIVTDARGRILSHTFDQAVPQGLIEGSQDIIPPGGKTWVLGTDEGLILESIAPVSGGNAGYMRVGVSDRDLEMEIASLTRAVLIALGTSAVIGLCLAMLLTAIITRPLQQLNFVTAEIRRGRYGIQAPISSEDEIGILTKAFNHLSNELKVSHSQILEKEAARLRLVHKAVSAQEEERKRISRELHDELGQSLSALLLFLQTAAKDPSLPRERIFLDIGERTRSMLEMVRKLAWDLRPSILDDYGLPAALSRYIEDTSRECGIKMDFQYSARAEEKRLPDRVEVTLFRIAQEAISNVLRHSCAKHASVVLMKQDRTVILLIEDDGKGFDVAGIRQEGGRHLGLLGMEERAALIDGELTLESDPGKRTMVRIRIPLEGGEVCPSAL